MSRPASLFPLFASIETLTGIGPKTVKNFEALNITRPRDLLLTLPYAGHDRRRRPSLQGVPPGTVATVELTIGRHVKPARKGGPYRIDAHDGHSEVRLVYFNAGGDWLEQALPFGARRLVSGKVEYFEGRPQIVHPDHVLDPADAASLPEFEPIWPLTSGVTHKLYAKAVTGALTRLPNLDEWIEPSLLRRESWPSFFDAVHAAQNPRSAADLAPLAPARARLAYDELFAHQLTLALARASQRKIKGRPSQGDGALRRKLLQSLPYQPTSAQVRAVSEIAGDMASAHRMNRLLQGDVGSGKTLVAAEALLIAVEAGGQGALMAPTEILARQHLEGLKPLMESAGVVIELLTGRDKGAERAAKLAALAQGDIQILVGTHALFQADVQFHDLRLAVVDEQHRFGVAQRMELGAKGALADVLVMTATPIPRSLALAQFGDMDVSILDEKPAGRLPIKTVLVSAQRNAEVVARLKAAVAEGKQAYWVCPLVDESEVSSLPAAEDRFQKLRAELGPDIVGLVHGQLPAAEKDAAMADFVTGKTRILVATTVIEVGVNVPNASIIVIEGAETFGLAQLHQLRGRVGRGSAASTCLLMYGPLTQTGQRRLEVLRDTEDGFRIAEEDLAIRGAGDLIGTAQSGLPRFRIADLEKQTSLMKMAQDDARMLLTTDPDLTSPRGRAARVLLWLMEQDKAIRLITVG